MTRPLTKRRAENMLQQLSQFYGQRVCTAQDHCDALMTWMNTLAESGYAPQVREAYSGIYLYLIKSNLAARLVYGGEKLRSTPCPIHKGHWSGCTWGSRACPEGCMYGSNITGWLPDSHEFVDPPTDAVENNDKWFHEDGFSFADRCWICGGIREAYVHGETQ